MNKKMICAIIFSILISTEIMVNAESFTNKKNNNASQFFDEVNTPNWQVGNYWTYKINVEGDFGEALEFSWTSNNLNFIVDSISSSGYSMSLSGDINGEITLSDIQIIKGTLKETTLSGNILVDKSNIGFKEIDVTMQGKISIIGIPIKPFTLDLDITISPAFSGLVFPIDIGKTWTIPTSSVGGKAQISLLQNPIYIDDLYGGDVAKCSNMEPVQVGSVTYNSYNITTESDIAERYYSEGAGNIVKAFGDQSKCIDFALVSTNYENSPLESPSKPSKPSGPTSGDPGVTYEYTSSTTDPQGDQIYYLFDWGDESDSGWLGPYESGESVTASHKWSREANYKIKVKAKDPEDHESLWSDPLSVSLPRNRIRLNLIHLLEKYVLLIRYVEKLLS